MAPASKTRSYKSLHEQSRRKAGIVFYCPDLTVLFCWAGLTHVGHRVKEELKAEGKPPLEVVSLFFMQQMVVTITGYRLARMITDCQQGLTDYVRVSWPKELLTAATSEEPLVLEIEVERIGKPVESVKEQNCARG